MAFHAEYNTFAESLTSKNHEKNIFTKTFLYEKQLYTKTYA